MAVQRHGGAADGPGQSAGDIVWDGAQRLGHGRAGVCRCRQCLGQGAIDLPGARRALQAQRNRRQMRAGKPGLHDRRRGGGGRVDDHFMRVAGDDGIDPFDAGNDPGGIFGARDLPVAMSAMAERDDHIRPARTQRRCSPPGRGDDILCLQVVGQFGLPIHGLGGSTPKTPMVSS